MKFSDEFLPTQHEYRRLFTGSYASRLYAAIMAWSGIVEPADRLDLAAPPGFPLESMASNPVNQRLLDMLLRISGAASVLEIGSYIGISAIHFARALPAEGRVVTIEKGAEFAALARRNIAANGAAAKVELIHADASEALPRLRESGRRFDVIFIDGAKEHYLDWFEMCEGLAQRMIVADDVLFNGDVLNPLPTTEKGRGVKRFLDHVATLDNWERSLLPMGNGMLLMVRK